MSTSDLYNKFLNLFARTFDIGAIRQGLQEVQTTSLSRKEVYELQVYAFKMLQQLTVEDYDTATPLILEDLLPNCLVNYPEIAISLHEYRQCLADWLEQYPEHQSQPIREQVLDKLLTALNLPEPRQACWAISHIGYRRDDIVNKLWQIIKQNDDEMGNIALSTLINLGVANEDRETILTELHRRASINHEFLIYPLIQLADYKSVDVIWPYFVQLTSDNYNMFDVTLLNIFKSIFDAYWDDAKLQDNLWLKLIKFTEHKKGTLIYSQFQGIFPHCNSSLVVPDVLKQLHQETEGKSSGFGRYRRCSTVGECVRPNQLKGWERFNDTQTITLLQTGACQNTGDDGTWITMEDRDKEESWKTLLRLGYAECLTWLDQALINEDGRFTQQKIMKLLACFQIDPLPAIVSKWIEQEQDFSTQEDGRMFAQPRGATRLAHSAVTKEAFNILLNFGFTTKGIPYLISTKALSDVALHLVKQGNQSITEQLVSVIVNSKKGHQQIAAAATLKEIVKWDNTLALKYKEQLLPILYGRGDKDDVKKFVYGEIILILSYLDNEQIPSQLISKIKKWATSDDHWLSRTTFDFLAQSGYLIKDEQLLKEVLGLELVADKWDVQVGFEYSWWATYFVGFLYASDPDRFLPAIITLIKEARWQNIAQLMAWLLEVHENKKDKKGRIVPEILKKTLVNRILKPKTGIASEVELIDITLKLAPEMLLDEKVVPNWPNWEPTMRLALANALGETTFIADNQLLAIERLSVLTHDSQFMVRRAAYRGLARQAMDTLYKLCKSWAIDDAKALRLRAAEAYGWLKNIQDAQGKEAFIELHQILSTDRERMVRETVKQTEEARLKRLWAEEYFEIVKQVTGKNNKEILAAWRYGNALSQVGDDFTIKQLEELLKDNNRPPNVQYWIQQIIEQLRKNWKEATQKWPEPWFTWEGITKKGTVWLSDKKFDEVCYSIWSHPPLKPFDFDSWGGVIWPVSDSQFHDLGSAILKIENIGEGKINITQYGNNKIVFRGTGSFEEYN